MKEKIASLNRRIQELEEFHRLAQSLSCIAGLLETLEAIGDCCLRLCRAEQVAIVLTGPAPTDSAKTVVRNKAGSEGGIDHILNSLMAGWVQLHNEPLITDDVLRELNVNSPRPRFQSAGPALAIPLTTEGTIIGVINLVNSRNGDKFSPDSLSAASVLAPLATQFILRARANESLFEDNRRMKCALREQHSVESIIGESPSIRRVKEHIIRVASSQANVFISGETGTGKELVARAIHFHSPRSEKPFIAVNCAAVPATLVESELFGHEQGAFTGATEMKKGTFESAHTGTLFLDEVSAMPLDLQPKLLRVLEERSFCRVGSSDLVHIDVRLVSASNKDLTEAIKRGAFRDDLYQRLDVVSLYLPTLRERREDIPLLARTFLQEFSHNTKCFAADAEVLLSEMEWRGNVRELRNFVERVSIFSDASEVKAVDLRSLESGIQFQKNSLLSAALREMLNSDQLGTNLVESVEKELLRLAFEQSHGNISKAAELIGIDRNALQRRLDKFDLR
jgi:transcriptional regulator with GAF, ATPase, and Fis domain